MTVNAGEDLINKLAKLGKDTDKIAKKVVRAGANPLADEIRKNLENNLKDSTYAGKDTKKRGTKKSNRRSGDLLDSLGVSPAKIDKYGNANVKVGFDGYDKKGTPNVLKARAMESGTSTLKKRPFIRPAINKTSDKCKDEMSKKFDEEIKIYAL